MKVVAIDPGGITGICIMSEDFRFKLFEIDVRSEKNNHAKTKKFAEDFCELICDQGHNNYEFVVEDFVLRQGQAVDIIPAHLLGFLVGQNIDYTYYSPGAHKTGNKHYDLTQWIKETGQRVGEGHVKDALSLAVHHMKRKEELCEKILKKLNQYKK